MDTTTLQNQLAVLGAAAGGLEERLSEVDAKLTAFLSAVHAGQAALLELARRIAPNAAWPHVHMALTLPSSVAGTLKPELTGSGGAGAARPEGRDSGGRAESTPAAAAPPAPVDTAADEALLRELDAETANVIRVRRRLSGGRRSVRELLEEYRAGQRKQ